MDEKENSVERREYERYKVSNDVSVMFRNGFMEIGQLLNISVNGMALSYISGDKRINSHLGVCLFSRDHIFLNNIPFSVISDVSVDDMTLFNTMIKKRCSGQFGELTKQQRSYLDYFIANHTIG